MPYIPQPERAMLTNHQKTPENAGELNYLITEIIQTYLKQHGLRYQNINDIVGVLECAKLELYRRVAAGYEDEKVKQNGDVYIAELVSRSR